MDDLLPLLLIGFMYLVPALWRRFIAKKVPPLQEPEQVIIPEMEMMPQESPLAFNDQISDLSVPGLVAHEQSIPLIREETSAWEGKLTEETVINGLIFAEILYPPRAYRPFLKRK